MNQYQKNPSNRLLDPQFLMGTWTGRILIFNTFIFALMSIMAGSVMEPPIDVLLNFGAKDPVKLVQGEWWRFITPVFVHIGIVHFLFNSYALKILGPHIEEMLGSRWFLFLYLITGIAGNVASSLTNLGIGAGASGAIFGLIGAGFLVERFIADYSERIGYSRPRSMYTGLIVINLAFGFLIPGIDNAAHIGGLVTGMGLAYGMFFLKPNRIKILSKAKGYGVIGGIFVLLLIGGFAGVSESFTVTRLKHDAQSYREEFLLRSDEKSRLQYGVRAYQAYTQLIELDSNDQEALFFRGSLLILSGDVQFGMKDFDRLDRNELNRTSINELIDTLFSQGEVDLGKHLREYFSGM